MRSAPASRSASSARSDVLAINNYLARSDTYYRVARIEFADGTVWNRSDLESRIVAGGTPGDDTALGTSGDDTLHGLGGNDTLYGYDGSDALFGDGGNDTIEGGAGNDLVDGGAGTDLLRGEDGTDTLVDGETMFGGNGSDTYTLNSWTGSITIQDVA